MGGGLVLTDERSETGWREAGWVGEGMEVVSERACMSAGAGREVFVQSRRGGGAMGYCRSLKGPIE